MLKITRARLRGFITGLILPALAGMATPAFARSVTFKDAGIALWVFIIIGAVVVLLQLVPAAILFFSFIGKLSGMAFNERGGEPVKEEEKVTLPGYEPVPAKK